MAVFSPSTRSREFEWKFVTKDGIDFQIINRVSGKAIRQPNVALLPVELGNPGTKGTLWTIERDGETDYWRIINKATRFGLAIAGLGKLTDVHAWNQYVDHSAYRWSIERVRERFPLVIRNDSNRPITFELKAGKFFDGDIPGTTGSSTRFVVPAKDSKGTPGSFGIILDREAGQVQARRIGLKPSFKLEPQEPRFRGKALSFQFNAKGKLERVGDGSAHISQKLKDLRDQFGRHDLFVNTPTVECLPKWMEKEIVTIQTLNLPTTDKTVVVVVVPKDTLDSDIDAKHQKYAKAGQSALQFRGLSAGEEYEARLYVELNSDNPTVDARCAFEVVAWPKLTVKATYKVGDPVVVEFDKPSEKSTDLIVLYRMKGAQKQRYVKNGEGKVLKKYARADADNVNAVSFPGGADLPAGQYQARLARMDGTTLKMLSQSKPFKIGGGATAIVGATPTGPVVLTMADEEFKVGEDVVLTYGNLPKISNGGYHHILLFKNGGTIPVREQPLHADKQSVTLFDVIKGHYVARLFTAGSKTAAEEVSFVVLAAPSISVPKDEYPAGYNDIVVQFRDLRGAKGDEIKVFLKKADDDDKPLGEVLTKWKDSGTPQDGFVTVGANLEEGNTYEVRYFEAGSPKATARCEFKAIKKKEKKEKK